MPLCRTALDVSATTGLAAQPPFDREHATALFAPVAFQKKAQTIDRGDMPAFAGNTQIVVVPGVI